MLDNPASSLPGAAEKKSGSAPRLARVRRIEVHHSPSQALAVWAELEGLAALSPYQTRCWLLPWMETTGRSTEIEPFFVVAYDDAGRALAMLPFGLWRQGFLTVAGFLGGRDSNYNLGLFRPGLTWPRAAVSKLLRTAVRAAHRKVDLLVLRNQPHHWEGVVNPLLLLANQPSPSFGHKVALFRDPDEFFKNNLSGDNRKKLRKKWDRLRSIGPTRHEKAMTPEGGAAILDAFVAQRAARCMALGLGLSDLHNLKAFLQRASVIESGDPAVELHALYCGSRIVATFGGTSHRDRFCGMIMSFDSSPEVSKCSPGEILLAALIETKCREGYSVFDLGIGEGRYKQIYCPEPDPLFDSVMAVSMRGRLFGFGEKARLRLKRRIKQSPWAWRTARHIRKVLSSASNPVGSVPKT